MNSQPTIQVVTDSTASLAADEPGIVVVPLRVTIGDETYLEGAGLTPDDVADRLAMGERITTSQPTPRAVADAFTTAAEAGASGIVAIHMSGEMSGTCSSARIAAIGARVPTRVVDSRTVAMALGFAARAAAEAARAGADLDAVAARATRVAASSRVAFMVDSLEHLRRGGRLSAPAAAIGAALRVRPLLTLRDGRIEVVQSVRTRATAVDRLVDVAVASAARRRRPAFAVHFLGSPEVADDVAGRLTERTGVEVETTPVSAVVGAHAGPGVLAIVIADLTGGALS